MDVLIYSLFFFPGVGAINILHIFTSADGGLINTVPWATRKQCKDCQPQGADAYGRAQPLTTALQNYLEGDRVS